MENNPLYVPVWQVFPFNFIKKPFISSLWFVLLVYTIWNPYETLPTVLGIVFLILSFTIVRLYFAILSPIPCIATMILAFKHLVNPYPIIILAAGIIWFVLYFIAIFVWRRVAKKEYVLSPVTNHLMYNPTDYLMPGKGRR